MSHRNQNTRLSEWADLVGASLPDSLAEVEDPEETARDAADIGPGDGEHGRPN